MTEDYFNIIYKQPASFNKRYKRIVKAITNKELVIFQYGFRQLFRCSALAIIFYTCLLCIFEYDYLFTESGAYSIPDLIVVGGLFLMGFIFLFLSVRIKKRIWKFNRLTQKVIVPKFFTGNPCTYQIHDLRVKSFCVFKAFNIWIPLLYHKSKWPISTLPILLSIKNNCLFGVDVSQELSFYLWYLDRNRPLPPGELFDSLRENDFLRRRSDNFKLPLFYADVATPEFKEEHQYQRDEVWKDEDYINNKKRIGDLSLRDKSAVLPLLFEEEAQIITQEENPDEWRKNIYPEVPNFSYLPTAYAMRYVLDNKQIRYAFINPISKEVFTPPLTCNYHCEIIRRPFYANN